MINLQGFTSTTLLRDTAVEFAIDEDKIEVDDPEQQPLIVEIVLTGKLQFFYLNNKELSAFPGEQEVLLQEGLQYRVINVKKQIEVVLVDNKEYKKKMIVV